MKMEEEINRSLQELEKIKRKFNNDEKLNFGEIEKLGLFYQIENNNEALLDSRFDYFKFRQLYLIYGRDFQFGSNTIFYKRNPDKRFSEIVDFKKLRAITSREYNQDTKNKLDEFFIKEELLIPIRKSEIEQSKQILQDTAEKWAKFCLDERHSDENSKVIAKETRDTLESKNIKLYVDELLGEDEETDIFKGLLKSHYIFHEAHKILDHIRSNNEPKEFRLNGVKVEFIFYSLVHILNRHYAESLSSESIINSKSFHNSKIDPYHINLFIADLFSLIMARQISDKIDVKRRNGLLIKFYNVNYALIFGKYKYDKSKIILKTFFIVDEKVKFASRFIDRINTSEPYELDDNLIIYIEK